MEQSSDEASDQKTNGSCFNEKSSYAEKDLISDAVGDDSREFELANPERAVENYKNVKSTPGANHNFKKSVRKRKRVPQKAAHRRLLLRSSLDGIRVLRSMSRGKNKTSTEPSNSTVNPITRKRGKKTKGKSTSNNEFSLTRKHIRYLLTRINYEQNLIDAYSNEGWKGQSLEKIRPEKELERAKSEILRCKLRIRESFHHLDSLLSEGRIEENLFDDDDEIDSEDIFCAKCGSKDLSVDNDIILCDGNCDRGFHQKCLNPPLPTDEIPPGDQGWLCPACDCKVDCLDLLNEIQGSDLSIEDTWEKVFPEAAALANGNRQCDDSNYPSDDSEDNDYDPDVPEVTTEDHEEGSSSNESSYKESSSEESDSTSLSEDSVPPKYNTSDVLGLPSDDSDDDDYDPECPDADKDVQNKDSESNESDFTSDSDEFCAELSKITNTNEVSTSSLLDSMMVYGSVEQSDATHKNPINTGLSAVMEADPGQNNTCSVSKKGQRQRLDYNKPYDEAYGKASSDSSEDEDWSEKGMPKKVKKDDNRKESAKLPDATTLSVNNQRSSIIKGKIDDDAIDMANSDQPQVSKAMNESTADKTHQYLGEHQVNDQLHGANGNKATTSVRRHFGQKVYQKLQEIFKENQYPNRETKESLAEELGLTARQISKWFENSRHSLRISVEGSNLPGTPVAVSHRETNHSGTATPDKGNTLIKFSRKNTKSSKSNAKSATADASNEKRSNKANNCKNQSGHGIHSDDKSKRTVESSRQKAIARELRKRRNSR